MDSNPVSIPTFYESPTGADLTPPGGGSKKQYRRSYKACLNCRERKVRCDLGDLSAPLKPPCLRCRREGRDCVFGESRRGGVNNVRTGLQRKAALAASKVDKNQPKLKQEDNLISKKELHNTTDALEILAHAARSFPKISDGEYGFGGNSTAASASGDVGSSGGSNTNGPAGLKNSKNLNGAVKPNGSVGAGTGTANVSRGETPLSAKLSESSLVAKDKIVTEEEARKLIEYFFSTLHPFYPFIPSELHEADKLAEVPILLAAITTLASRYCKVLREDKVESLDIHAKLWDHCQTLISKTVWAEASTRSVGTVFAFLLFSEWNPRAIHQRWHDYANDGNESSNQGEASSGITGFGASRRSDRMAWMLIGNGIRLAQDLGLMETDSKVFLATHLSEIVLSLRMGRRSMLHQSLNEPVPEDLKFTDFERAKLGLLQIMSLAHETLYGSRKTTRELLKNGSYLTFLSLFGPHLDNWERTCRELLKTSSLERESILFDYHYARLYIYSLALCSAPDTSSSANVAEIIPSSRYVGMATDAAKELLAVANRVHEMGVLGQAPIRWVVRIVHSTIFLVKSIMLTPTSSLESHRHTLSMIRKIAQTMQESSPDDIHLSTRFGTIIMTLHDQLANTIGVNEEQPGVSSSSQSDVKDEQSHTKATPFESSNAAPSVQANQTAYSQIIPQPQDMQDAVEEPQASSQQQSGDGMFEFSRYSFADQEQVLNDQNLMQYQYQQQQQQQQQPQQQPQQEPDTDQNQNLLSMMDMQFDFLMEGTEGLGFVEPLIEGIEQQQIMQKQQQ